MIQLDGTPPIKADWENPSVQPPWTGANYASLPNSTPPNLGQEEESEEEEGQLIF
jgi:hypothetical protein